MDIYKELDQRADEKSKIKPILEFMRSSLQQETNFMHHFCLDENFLKSIAKEIRYQINDMGD